MSKQIDFDLTNKTIEDIETYLEDQKKTKMINDHIKLLRKELHRCYLPLLQSEFGFETAKGCIDLILSLPVEKWNYIYALNAFRECCEIAKRKEKETIDALYR
jgi:hypothetical protein